MKRPIFRHYKGGLYVALALDARLEATQESVVVYRALRDGSVWVRPYAEFFGEVVRAVSTAERKARAAAFNERHKGQGARQLTWQEMPDAERVRRFERMEGGA